MLDVQSLHLITQVLIMVFDQYCYMRSAIKSSQRKLQLYRRNRSLQRAIEVIGLVEEVMYPRIPRRTWMRPRSVEFWKDIVLHSFTNQDWLKNFRMSKATFDYLCSRLRPVIERKDTHLRKAISVKHRLAITLWTLATPCEYRTVGHLFRVARSTVCVIVHKTCKAIFDVLFSEYVTFPKGRQLEETIRGFETRWQIPQCAGAIDGSHIPVSVPVNLHTDYYNRKGWYSMLVQAVVNYNYTITDVNIGWPGSVHDARVFVHSGLYQKATAGELLPQAFAKDISGVQVPPYLIADAAYPLKTWLMKPFPDRGLSSNKRTFNYRLSRARMVVENAFGRLKGRWRRLLKRCDMSLNNVPVIVAACCVLHNLCERYRDDYDDAWNEAVAEVEREAPQPDTGHSDEEPQECTSQEIRRALMTYFVNNPLT